MVSWVIRAGVRLEQGVFLPVFGYERIQMSLSLHEEVLGLASDSLGRFIPGVYGKVLLHACAESGAVRSGEYLVSSVTMIKHSKSNLGRKGLI